MTSFSHRAVVIAAVLCFAGGCRQDGAPQADHQPRTHEQSPANRQSHTDGQSATNHQSPADHADAYVDVDEPDSTPCDGRPVEVLEQKWDDGVVQQREEIVRDDNGDPVRHGRFETFWEDGSPKLEMSFVCGTRHGPKLAWHGNGQLWQEGWYFNSRDHGTWTTYYPDGTIQQQFTLEKGTWHGPFTQWHPNGQKKLEFMWIDGLRQGTERLWDETGTLRRRVDYVDGVPQPMATAVTQASE